MLYFAGRFTLAKSVVQALPTYVMQSNILPVSICEEIDKKKCRSFVWGNSSESRKTHGPGWNGVCMPKSMRKTRHVNQALLVKVGWQLCNWRKDTWVSK